MQPSDLFFGPQELLFPWEEVGGGRWRERRRRGGEKERRRGEEEEGEEERRKERRSNLNIPEKNWHSGNQDKQEYPNGIVRPLGLLGGVPCSVCLFPWLRPSVLVCILKSLSNEGSLSLFSPFYFKSLREGFLRTTCVFFF